MKLILQTRCSAADVTAGFAQPLNPYLQFGNING